MGLFKFKKRSEEITPKVDDILLKGLFESQLVGRAEALNIPAVARCVNLISETVSMLPIKLYKETFVENKRKTTEITDDERCRLLNEDTRDTLDGVQFKRALVRDYLLDGNAYSYINKRANTVKSLHYVACRNVFVKQNYDPIFKDYDILVGAETYKPFDFVKITRATEGGVRGVGIIEENREIFTVAYLTLKFEQNLVSTGGSKKGFIKAEKKITKEAMDTLKRAWRELYCNNENNVIVLNENLDFKEASNTSTEMQLNENKNSLNNSILEIFGVPTNWSYETFIKTAIIPVLTAIECALNKDLLFEKEKRSFYFAFDTKEITKGDIKTRFEAYKTVLDSNLMQIDECRYMEDLEPLGLNFIKLGLQDVLFNPATKEVYTPNTGLTTNIESGGEAKNADRNQE